MAGVLGTVSGQVKLDIRQAVASYAALRAQNQRLVYALRGTGDSFVASGRTMMIAGGGLLAVFGKVITAAGDFERKMDFAAAVTGTTGSEMQKLSDYALQLGKDTIYSAGQIADGFIELAKAGVSADQIIHGVGEAMTSLGAAADIPLAQSGQIIVTTLSQFGKGAEDASKMVDILAGAANASIADVSDLGVSLKYVGGVAHQNSQTFEDTATALAILANAGIRGSTAGTSLRQMLVSLPGVTKPAKEALKQMGIITKDGTNRFYDMQGNLKPLPKVFQILQKSLKGYNNEQKTVLLRQLFNNRALGAAVTLTGAGSKGFRDMWASMSKVKAADVAHQRLDNLSGDIEILRGNIETLVIEQGGPLQKSARGWVQSLTRLIQAYSKLNPAVQENILKTIGAAGVVLTAMGAFNIIVGTIFKFAASLIKMGAGVKFAVRMLKILIVNARLAMFLFGGPLVSALAAISAPVLIIIAVLAALAVAFVIAYKKSETFRNIVNGIASVVWDAIKAVGKFVALLATNPGKAWEQIKTMAQGIGDAIVNAFSNLGSKLAGWFSAGTSAVSAFIMGIVQWFASLPGQVVGIITSFVATVTNLLTFRNIGFAIGFLIGLVVRLWITMVTQVLTLTISFVTSVVGFFLSLPGRIGYAIGFLVGLVVRGFIALITQVLPIVARLVAGVIGFFASLPGRVAGFVASMVARAISLAANMAATLPGLAARAVAGIINFISTLPGRVAGLIGSMVNRARQLMAALPSYAAQIGHGIVSGITSAIQGLPGLVGGILQSCISAFRGVVSQAFNAARDFAGGLWEGFKSGLGINSPSFIEKHMVQMNETVAQETKTLAKQTMDVQALGKKWIASSTLPKSDSGASSYMSLASMQSRNQKRAGTLATSLGSGGTTRTAPATDSSSGQKTLVSGTLAIDESGTAFITGVAEDAADRFSSDNDRRDRMYYDGE
jgi:TP901 family phage tail tape measure protein